MNYMFTLLAVGSGGFLGASLRFVMTNWLSVWLPQFPLGTLISNYLASIFFGVLIGLERYCGLAIAERLRQLITAGFLGGLSTFSTFSFETVKFIESGSYLKAGLNTLLNLVLSLGGVLLGMMAAKFFLSSDK
jgi:CrcB protein